jgi:anti-sigma factor RsiW
VRCTEAQTLIESYVDGELDLVRNLDIERHLSDCPGCTSLHKDALELRSRILQDVPYYRASPDLLRRVRAVTRGAQAETKRSWVPVWAPAWTPAWVGSGAVAALVLLAVITVGFMRRASDSSREQMITQEIVSDHVRSLMANHLTDVTSTDQHTVKPWFHGKLDFAPPVDDFAPEGFPLIGGRLDYLEGHPVAALVYQRRQHPINLFVWAAEGKYPEKPARQTLQGYNIFLWARNGMTYCAVSDLAADEMQTFTDLLRK